MRVLPGVYSSIEDLSYLPEGSGQLAVALLLKANKGPVNTPSLQNNIQDLLTTYTFTGAPSSTDDKAFHLAKEVLKQTTQLYVVRPAVNALYGGLIVKKEDLLGDITAITTSPKTIKVSGDVTTLVTVNDVIRVSGISSTLNGRYTVVSSSYATSVTTIVVSETPSAVYTYTTGTKPQLYLTRQPIPFNQQLLGAIAGVDLGNNTIDITGDVTNFFPQGDKILIGGSTGNNGTYLVYSAEYVNSLTKTVITLEETLPDATVDGNVYRHSIVEPNNYEFQAEDLFIVTGKDQGDYNGLIEMSMTSYKESPESVSEDNTFELSFYDSTKNELLELTYVVNRDIDALATDGTGLYIEDVIENSSYVKVVNNTGVTSTELPCNTVSNVQMSGGYNGDTLIDSDLVAAMSEFEDKAIPIDLIANGSTETATFQSSLIALAEQRQDCFVFLNTRLTDELATSKSMRATNIETYKRTDVASTSFYAAMYAPHVTITDVWNSRKVVVGADTKVIPGWLSVINNQGYPFANAGYRYGKVSGITTDWKIAPDSGEAGTLNNASINFIAHDPKQGTYVNWTQNTLQVANSAMRDIGVVLNVLDIKKTLVVYLQQYLNLPITDSLRSEILFKVDRYMSTIKSSDRVIDYAFQDVITDLDVANSTLNYILTISPSRYAQKIYLKVRVVDATFDFQILQRL